MEDEKQKDQAPAQRFQFSLTTMLLCITISGLALALVLANLRLTRNERELATMRPLPVEEVARQFEAQTTRGSIAVTVDDVRYSADDDAYLVAFSWIDATTGKNWAAEVTLTTSGFGRYSGTIHNAPFIRPLDNTNGVIVVVETPSSLER